jgi:type VI secretion system protein
MGWGRCGWLGVLVLVACSEVMVKTQFLVLAVDEHANWNHPIAVDLVLIYDEALLEEIVKLSASEWFTQRAQLKQDYPISLATWEWELVPAQSSPAVLSFQMPPERKEAKAALFFANYLTPGSHRVRIDAMTSVKVHLQEQAMVVQPLEIHR